MKNLRIVAIASGGGHLKEILDSLSEFEGNSIIYVTHKTKHTLESLSNKKKYFIIDPHVSLWKYIINSLQTIIIYTKTKPHVVISTGAGIAVPFILFSRLLGSKIIFIETGARINKPSKTGKFLYPFSHLFIVQYQSLLKQYPKAKLGSLK